MICKPLQLPKTLRLFAALDQPTEEKALSQEQTVLMGLETDMELLETSCE